MINKTEIFRKIGGILDELNEQYQYMEENPGNFNELELELFSANADFLSEHSKILLKLSAATKADKPATGAVAASAETKAFITPKPVANAEVPAAPPATERREEPVSPEPVTHRDEPVKHPEIAGVKEVTPLPAPVTEAKAAVSQPGIFSPDTASQKEENGIEEKPVFSVKPEPVHVAPQPVREPERREPQFAAPSVPVPPPAPSVAVPSVSSAPAPAAFSEPFAPSVPVSPVTSVPVPPATSAPQHPGTANPQSERPSQAQPHVPTINELISAGKEKQQQASGQFQTSRITDLKSGISLNDKLLFIKDLFNGYSLAYSEAIEILNRFDSFQAAEQFLNSNYAGKNNWADKQHTADKFFEILHKRFG